MKLHPVNKEQIKQETKVFFRSQRWKNLLVFLVFVGIASIFWLMQYFQQTGDYDATVSTRNPHSETTLSPDSLSGTGREIPIRISGTLSPAAGYRFVDSLRIEPGKTWVSGDKNILDTLQWIYTQTVNVEKIQKNVHINVKLQVPKGLTAS
ncbi:MAG: YbbR-like domain-containing protein, partial [Dysgonamonadaceae bacterium]|nr:YbbR-like domain-containing protein [Dysgonamonadaceae bacterium]